MIKTNKIYIMKTLFYILITFLSISISSCNKEDNVSKTPPKTPTEIPDTIKIKILEGPYLIKPGNTTMNIRWELPDTLMDYSVEYGIDTVTSSIKRLNFKKSMNGTFILDANLTELQEGETYFYRITTTGGIKQKWNTFKTYTKNQDKFTFVAMGDSRSNPRIFSQIMNNASNTSPDLIVSVGDLVIKGGNYSEWGKYFFAPASKYITSIPFASTLGDHETELDNGALFNYFLMDNEPVKEQWFSFDYGNAHFISLDYREADSKDMQDWFTEDVAKANKKWNFVIMHRPVYNFGGHRSSWGMSTWSKLFQSSNIDIVFAGHSHLYERFYPVRPDNTTGHAVTYVTSGGAGAELYEAVTESTIMPVSESVNHLITVQIDNNTLKYTATRIDGSILDNFEIVKNGDNYNSEYENEMISRSWLNTLCSFNSEISDDMDVLPTDNAPGILTIGLKLYLPDDLPIKIELNGNTDVYGMETIETTLKSHTVKNYRIEIKKKGNFKVEHAKLVPELRLKLTYDYNNQKKSIVGGAVYYWK